MDDLRATRDSWDIDDMPTDQVALNLDLAFTKKEMGEIQLGLIPKIMDDKWFIMYEDDWLYFHRSWTGQCVFKIRFEYDGDRFHIAEAWTVANPDRSEKENAEWGAGLVKYLIERLLLARDVELPGAPDDSITKHVLVGWARARNEPVPLNMKLEEGE